MCIQTHRLDENLSICLQGLVIAAAARIAATKLIRARNQPNFARMPGSVDPLRKSNK